MKSKLKNPLTMFVLCLSMCTSKILFLKARFSNSKVYFPIKVCLLIFCITLFIDNYILDCRKYQNLLFCKLYIYTYYFPIYFKSGPRPPSRSRNSIGKTIRMHDQLYISLKMQWIEF